MFKLVALLAWVSTWVSRGPQRRLLSTTLTPDTSIRAFRILTFDKEFATINDTDTYDYSPEFIDFMRDRLHLNSATSKILHSKQISPELFLTLNEDVATFLNIDKLDSIRIIGFGENEKTKKQEIIRLEEAKQQGIIRLEEAKQQGIIRLEEAKQQRIIRLEEAVKRQQLKAEEHKRLKDQRAKDNEDAQIKREQGKKSIFVFDPDTNLFENVTLYDTAAFFHYTTILQVTGFKRMLPTTPSTIDQSLILPDMFDALVDGAYYGYGKIRGNWKAAIDDMKSRELSFASELTKLNGSSVYYMSDPMLTSGLKVPR